MKEHRNKYIKVRMTPEEVREFKEKSAEYKTVSHYVRKALEEYSNVSVRKQLELMQELGSFYRRYQSELSHIGGNLNQVVKRANELAGRGLQGCYPQAISGKSCCRSSGTHRKPSTG